MEYLAISCRRSKSSLLMAPQPECPPSDEMEQMGALARQYGYELLV